MSDQYGEYVGNGRIGGGGGATTFIQLTDVPNSYAGQAGKMTIVNPGETGLIFAATLADSLTNAHIFVGNASNLPADVAVSGDLTLLNTGAFTVATVGGSSAANIHTAELAANAATAVNTASTIVKRDGSGNFATSTISSAGTTKAIDIANRKLYDSSGAVEVANWGGGLMTKDGAGILAGDLSGGRTLYDSAGVTSENWSGRTLYASDGSLNLDWTSPGTLKAGIVLLDGNNFGTTEVQCDLSTGVDFGIQDIGSNTYILRTQSGTILSDFSWAIANLSCNNLSVTGTCTSYNTIATVANGLSPILAQANLTTQGAAISATTIYAVPSTGAGFYRVCWMASVTRAASTSSVLGGTSGFRLTFTDLNDSVVKTDNPSAVITSAGNTTATTVSGSQMAYCKASTNLQYAFDYTSVGGTTMQYDLSIRVEYLG